MPVERPDTASDESIKEYEASATGLKAIMVGDRELIR